jgi:hypothetical protein
VVRTETIFHQIGPFRVPGDTEISGGNLTEQEAQATGTSPPQRAGFNLSLTGCGVQACGHPTGSPSPPPSNPSQSEYYD